MIAWAIKSEDGGIIPFTVDASEADAWGRICGRGYIEHYKSNGYRAVRVEIREVEQNAAQEGSQAETDESRRDGAHRSPVASKRPDADVSKGSNPECLIGAENCPPAAAPTHDALADAAPIGYARKQDLLEYKPIVAMYDKPISPENGHAPVKLYSEDQVLHLLSALRQSGAGSKDAERYQLLRAGINLPRYGHGIGNRLADAALDAELDKALKERTE